MKPNIKQLSVTVAIWFASFFFTPAHAVVVDLSGIAVDAPVELVVIEDEFLSPGFEIGFWFEMESIGNNVVSDLIIDIEHLGSTFYNTVTGADCGFPFIFATGIFECDLFITIGDFAIPGVPWEITISDRIDDNVGQADFRFLEGSIIAWGDDLHLINGTKVPTPGTLALLALGLAGLGFAGRKKA